MPRDPANHNPPAPPARLTAEEFGRAFESSYRVFWLVAAGVLNDRVAADDAVQEAAIVALGKLDQFEVGTNFNAWMSQMVRFVALNLARREKHRRPAPVDPEVAAVGRSDAAWSSRSPRLRLNLAGQLPPDQEHFDDEIIRGLSAMSPEARACLLLRTVEGLPYREIARVLDIPEGTAMSHVHRGRQFLRQRLTAGRSGAQESGA